MIIGFSKHGQGKAAPAIKYLLDQHREGRENHIPEVVRGNPDLTASIIDSLTFKHHYTSGVLSFAAEDHVSAEQEKDIINDFEKLAFAGLQADQFNILWVRHSHAGHHELHFITPRIELSSKKSFNIKPPGKNTQKEFDDLRSAINAKYGFADPEDPMRARNVKTPSHELKIARNALREQKSTVEGIRQLIDSLLTERAVQGLIRDRQTLLTNVEELGFEVTRAGKNYITVKDPESSKRFRLKGQLYEQDFTPSRTIEAAAAKRTRDYSRPDPTAARQFEEQVKLHIRKRTEFNRERYRTTEPELRMEIPSISLADTSRDQHHDIVWPAVGRRRDNQALYPADQSLTGRKGRDGNDRRTAQQIRREDAIQPLRRKRKTLHQGEHTRDLRDNQRLSDREGTEIDNDGIRTGLTERLGKATAAIRATAEQFITGARRITADVRKYLNREHPLTTASRSLGRTIERFSQMISLSRKRQKQRGRSRSR